MAEEAPRQGRIILWCVPRSVSSALAKCMSGIEGMEMWFEPFTNCYVARDQYFKQCHEEAPLEYLGNEGLMAKVAKLHESTTLSKIEPDRIVYGNVKRSLETSTSRYVFVKDMAFSMPEQKVRDYIPSGYRHGFLIRDPIPALHSYRRSISEHIPKTQLKACKVGESADHIDFDLERDDVILNARKFYREIYDLFNFVREHHDPNPIVVDTDDLLTNPAEVLPKFCERAGLPYSEGLLHWDASTDIVKTWKAAGDRILLNITHFYERALTSSEFLPKNKPIPSEELSKDVLKLAEEAKPFYHEMLAKKI